MENTRGKKTTIFVLVLVVLTSLIFLIYSLITGKDNPFVDIIRKKNNVYEVKDNHNGFYSNYEELNGSKFIFPGCSINKLANVILVINEDYYTYRSSCMGTYFKSSGKTEDLEIEFDAENNNYYISYDDLIYDKDIAINNVVLNNDIEEKIKDIDLNNYQLFLKETEFLGNFYDIEDKGINNSSSDIKFNFIKNENEDSFILSLKPNNIKERILYQKQIKDMSSLPNIYPYGKNIVIIEKERNLNNDKLLAYTFIAINKEGVIYNLKEKFPIIIDGVTLNYDNSVYIKYDPAKRAFRMLVGYDDKMCVDNYDESETDSIVYYEFLIDYDYTLNNFDEPRFQKIGYQSEGCRYINSIMGD